MLKHFFLEKGIFVVCHWTLQVTWPSSSWGFFCLHCLALRTPKFTDYAQHCMSSEDSHSGPQAYKENALPTEPYTQPQINNFNDVTVLQLVNNKNHLVLYVSQCFCTGRLRQVWGHLGLTAFFELSKHEWKQCRYHLKLLKWLLYQDSRRVFWKETNSQPLTPWKRTWERKNPVLKSDHIDAWKFA